MELFKLLGTIAIEDKEARESFKRVQEEGEKTESKLGKVFSGIGKGAAVVGKAIGTGLLAGAGAVAALSTAAIKSYADYEQLVGGVETLFKESSDKVQEYAANAYKTAGMSANEYMETVTSFSASLLQSLDGDTNAAAEKANQAITDMSDNANKMGTDISMIQNAYQGFAKQNYTMLDNLKLGYGGTKEEMQRLLEDAEKISGIKYDISSYADVVDAIHVMQEEMGIAGTTAKEASTTIQGSLGMLKGAWSNLLTGLSDPDADLGALIDNVFSSVVTFGQNLIPRVTQVLTGIATAIQQLVPMLASELPGMLMQVLPALIQGAIALVQALVGALPGVLDALMQALPALINGIVTIVTAICNALPGIVQAIVLYLPTLIPLLIDGVVTMIMALVNNLPTILKILIATLPGIIISIVEALVNNLPVLIQGAIQLIMGIVNAIPQIIDALIGAIPTIVSLLVQALLDNLPAIIMGLIQIVWGIIQAIPQIFSALYIELPAALWSGIIDGLTQVFSGLGAWFGEKFSGAKEWAVNAWSDAKEKWTGIKNKVTDAFSSVGTWFKDKFAEGKKKAEESWSDAKEKWTNIKNKVADAFSDFGNKIKEKFTDAKTKAQNAWNDAKDKFSGVKDKVVSAFSNLKDKVSPLFSKAKDNAVKTWSTVKGSFEKIKKGDIVGAFNDLGSMLKGKFKTALNTAKKGFDSIKTIGKNLVEGLWNGIKNAKDWVLDKIKGFGESVLKGIKKIFGINSPSKETEYDGAMLAEGIAVGVKSKQSKAEKATEDLASAILDAAETKLEKFKMANDLSLKEEANYWDKVRVQIKEGTDARLKADKKYLEAKKSAEDAVYKDAEEWLTRYSKLHTITAEEELKFWEKVIDQCENGSDAWKKAEEKIAESKKKVTDGLSNQSTKLSNVYDELKKASDEFADSMADIQDKINDHTKSILGTFDLFEKYTGGNSNPISRFELAGNLKSQIKSLEMWDDELSKLEARIGGTDLFAEISAMGVEALSQVQEINKMTDQSLDEYVALYNRRTELASNRANKDMQDEANEMTQQAFQKFAERCAEIGVSVGEVMNGVKEVSITAFNGVSEGVGKISDKIGETLTKMKEAFESFSPKMKMPHFTISGELDIETGSVPTVNVEWYKKAMNNAMLLKEPTIFGYDQTSGKYLGGGEAGSEVVAGSSTLMTMIRGAVAEQNSTMTYYLQKLIQMLSSYFPQLIEAFDVDLYLDTGVLVGEMAIPMNNALGKLTSRKDRGR